jgi:hypothetical protein
MIWKMSQRSYKRCVQCTVCVLCTVQYLVQCTVYNSTTIQEIIIKATVFINTVHTLMIPGYSNTQSCHIAVSLTYNVYSVCTIYTYFNSNTIEFKMNSKFNGNTLYAYSMYTVQYVVLQPFCSHCFKFLFI